jgi:hypothetical protein
MGCGGDGVRSEIYAAEDAQDETTGDLNDGRVRIRPGFFFLLYGFVEIWICVAKFVNAGGCATVTALRSRGGSLTG